MRLPAWIGLLAAITGGAAPSGPPPGEVVTYRVVFSGSGTATSAYPPAPANTTIFTQRHQDRGRGALSLRARCGP
jgi:hypothetical protein